MKRLAVWGVLVSACGSPSEPADPTAAPSTAPASVAAPTTAAPTTVIARPSPPDRVEPVGSAPTDLARAPALNGGPVLAEPERRARFEARPVVVAPALLPKRFAALAGLAGGRLTGATYARQTAWEKAPNAEEVQLEVRLFGLTPEVEQTVLRGLRAAGLLKPDEPLPAEPVVQDTLRWHVRINPLRAPVDSPREHRIDFSWRRAPTTPDAAPECAKPLATDPPPELPAWLSDLLRTGSTRRLVATRSVHEAESDRAEGVLLFHNGESNDDHVGKLAKAAKAAGFSLAVGEFGNEQTWKRGDETFHFRPAPASSLSLGCLIRGPLLELVLLRSRPQDTP